MKRMMKFGLALFFTVFVAPVWAHHAAEGIVSDEIWDQIDEQLEEADSPHLNIDFDDVMGSMRVDTYPDDGDDLYLVTEVTAYVDEVADYMEVIDQVMEDIMNPTLDDSNQVPSGSMLSERNTGAFFEVDYVDANDDGEVDYATILLYEPIGNGNSFVDPGSEPPQSGARSGG